MNEQENEHENEQANVNRKRQNARVTLGFHRTRVESAGVLRIK
jgi:hypothetical protein